MAFAYYSAFTVKAAQIPSTQTNFTACIKWTDNRFRTVGNAGYVTSSSGYDIRPCTDATGATQLTYQLIPGTYSATTGTFEMWIKIPSAAVGSVVYMFYGDSGITTDGSSTSTWLSTDSMVLMLPDGTTLSMTDSTSNANNGTGGNTPTATTGQIDGGVHLIRASNQYITVADATNLRGNTGDFTCSAWFKKASNGIYGGFIAKLNAIDTTGYSLGMDGATDKVSWYLPIQSTFDQVLSLSAVTDTNWHYAVGTRQSGDFTVYLDAVKNTHGLTLTGKDYSNTDAVTVGPFRSGTLNANMFNGDIDIVRFRKGVAISDDWVTSEYNNQVSMTGFWDIGSQTPVGSSTAFSRCIMVG